MKNALMGRKTKGRQEGQVPICWTNLGMKWLVYKPNQYSRIDFLDVELKRLESQPNLVWESEIGNTDRGNCF